MIPAYAQTILRKLDDVISRLDEQNERTTSLESVIDALRADMLRVLETMSHQQDEIVRLRRLHRDTDPAPNGQAE